MPELPEVETMRRGILGAIGGKIVNAERTRCLKKPIQIQPSITAIRNRINNKRIIDVDRIGKRVVICVGEKIPSEFLVFEPRMTGLILVESPPTSSHLRFRLQLKNCDVDQILFWDRRGLGNVNLFNKKQLADRFPPSRIGPDALKISFAELYRNFSASKREIKVALLDQKLVAGIGNIYASEMLHLAKINPEQKCYQLTKSQYGRIFEQMKIVLDNAIRFEGSTLSDGTYRNALNQEGSYQSQHCVYDRQGEKCLQCKRGKIYRIVQAQRATFYCKNCQKLRGS